MQSVLMDWRDVSAVHQTKKKGGGGVREREGKKKTKKIREYLHPIPNVNPIVQLLDLLLSLMFVVLSLTVFTSSVVSISSQCLFVNSFKSSISS